MCAGAAARERTYSKSSKRERGLTQNPAREREDLFKIQQQKEDLLKIQQEREMAGSSDIHGGGALSGSRGGNARGRSIDDKTAGSSSKPRYRRTLDAASEKLLRRLNGKDVKMHPSIGRRKKRMCIVLPGQVSLSAAGGTIGMLEKLNTKEPVLYVDFPNVRAYVHVHVEPAARVHAHAERTHLILSDELRRIDVTPTTSSFLCVCVCVCVCDLHACILRFVMMTRWYILSRADCDSMVESFIPRQST